jgi:hypothetical protein
MSSRIAACNQPASVHDTEAVAGSRGAQAEAEKRTARVELEPRPQTQSWYVSVSLPWDGLFTRTDSLPCSRVSKPFFASWTRGLLILEPYSITTDHHHNPDPKVRFPPSLTAWHTSVRALAWCRDWTHLFVDSRCPKLLPATLVRADLQREERTTPASCSRVALTSSILHCSRQPLAAGLVCPSSPKILIWTGGRVDPAGSRRRRHGVAGSSCRGSVCRAFFFCQDYLNHRTNPPGLVDLFLSAA